MHKNALSEAIFREKFTENCLQKANKKSLKMVFLLIYFWFYTILNDIRNIGNTARNAPAIVKF